MGHARDPQQGPSEKQRRRQSGLPGPKPEEAGGDLEKVQKAVGNAAMSRMLDPHTSQTIEASLGGGKSLQEAAPAQRAPNGDAAGVGPHKDVRVHDDATAADVSKKLGAVAFTFGNDIFLAGDAPELDSAEGQRVLRHELTHVRQQESSNLGRPRKVSSPSSPAEREAAHAGDHGPGQGATSAVSGAVHRQEEEEEMMMMPADTVHRQEEEEEMMMMPADTVHRQEEEEEMLQPMLADTVHRQEEEEEASNSANPPLTAMFEATVAGPIREAAGFVAMDPPLIAEAGELLRGAGNAIQALAGSYSDSDPELAANLGAPRLLIISMTNTLATMDAGEKAEDAFAGNFHLLESKISEVEPTLH